MEVKDIHNRSNSNITGEYTIMPFNANGRNYYRNVDANRYLYSSPKGVWFVRKQYYFVNSNINIKNIIWYHDSFFIHYFFHCVRKYFRWAKWYVITIYCFTMVIDIGIFTEGKYWNGGSSWETRRVDQFGLLQSALSFRCKLWREMAILVWRMGRMEKGWIIIIVL